MPNNTDDILGFSFPTAPDLPASGMESIPGCMDETASNYNPEATQEDESCEYIKTLNLNKKIYGHKNLKENIDTEFSEFSVQNYSIEDFFSLYHQLFYDIPIKGFWSHQTILEKSIPYMGEYKHPRSSDIDVLYEQLQAALERLHSIEDEHSIIKNNSLVVEKGSSPPKHYFIQSFKKRHITGPKSKILNKIREIKGFPTDSDIEIPLSQDALALIPDGPGIGWAEDVSFSVLQVNLLSLDITDRTYLINTYGSGILGLPQDAVTQNNIFLY